MVMKNVFISTDESKFRREHFHSAAAANIGHSSTVGRLCARSVQLCEPKLTHEKIV